ncbi:MAG: zeta toxin family protein [Alphaproteobacteria bacterium]
MLKISDLMPDIGLLIPHTYEVSSGDEGEQIVQALCAAAMPVKNPCFVQISGIPGSGKSTYCKDFLETHPNYAYVSFDQIMERLTPYRQDVKMHGAVAAFEKWEIPARIMGYELLRRLIDKRANVLLEHSGVNEAHVQLAQNVKKLGYKTDIRFVMCPLETAMKRVKAREEQTHRHTPTHVICRRAAAVAEYYEKYTKVADIIQKFDTSRQHE